MVFRYSLKDLKRKWEQLDFKAPAMVDMEGCIISQLSNSCDQDFDYSQKNWYLLVYMLLKGSNNVIEDAKEILCKEMCAHCLDLIRLKKKKVGAMARAGENDGAQASDDGILPGLPDDTASDILAWTCRSDYPKLSCVSKKLNLLISSGYLYKLRRRLGVIEHWVYLACILMPWEAFDPVRGRWMRLPRIPCDDCFTYADKESLAVGTELLVFGRELSGFVIWKYSLLTRDWSRCRQMNLARCLFGSSSHGEIAIVAGGSDKNGYILNSAELYNSELDEWETLPDMNSPRKLCSGFFMDGKFYVIGGMSSNTNCLTCGEEYNIETRTWRRIEGMYPGSSTAQSPAMQSPPLVAVVNNQLYGADQVTNEVKKYDKLNNTWNIVRRLPVRADSSNGWGLAFKSCGDKLLVVGGHRGPEGEVIVLHSWRPEDGNTDGPEWNILSTRERAGAFVYNCAVMGC